MKLHGRQDPIIGTFPDKFMVGHWHGDMPGLTKESKVLATSAGCPRQIVRYSPKIYGFQCHKALPYIQTANALRSHNYESMNLLLFKFLDYIKSSINY